MAFCNNHERIYFDTLCRTKKAETLLSLIHATYQTKINNNRLQKTEKEEIAQKLKSAYELFKFDAGTYNGSLSAFESQYTIGHEMGIWKNSELDLTPLAMKVAEGYITIKDYFSIVFLNYIQPVKGKIIHILHCLLSYMDENNLTSVTKEQIAMAYNSLIPDCAPTESVNSVFNFLIATNYFKQSGRQEIVFNTEYDVKKLMDLCDITYLDETKYSLEQIQEKFRDLNTYLEYLLAEHNNDEYHNVEFNFNYSTTKEKGSNKIFYGVPGCGKSYYIEHELLGKDKVTKEYTGDYKEENIIRTTFYQDYSNTDFVGQILPKIVKDDNGEKDAVEYIFNPGPFTLALIRAISNPTKKVALIVEEINRGNAPAIFGDIFQLLDRDDNGISEYGILNVGIMDYLNSYEFEVDGGKKRYKFNEIKIPGNMYIFATMNTSDQNVYTLDTAFTRRWDKKKIPNDFVNKDDEDYFKKRYVPGTNVLWKTFADAVNKHITDNLDNLQVNEDKQLGAFFIKDNALSLETVVNTRTNKNKDKDDLKSIFAHKVLDYLWSDVSKFDHSIIFKPTNENQKKINTLDALIDEFKKNGKSIFQESVLKNMPDDVTTGNGKDGSNAIEDTDESVEIDG